MCHTLSSICIDWHDLCYYVISCNLPRELWWLSMFQLTLKLSWSSNLGNGKIHPKYKLHLIGGLWCEILLQIKKTQMQSCIPITPCCITFCIEKFYCMTNTFGWERLVKSININMLNHFYIFKAWHVSCTRSWSANPFLRTNDKYHSEMQCHEL